MQGEQWCCMVGGVGGAQAKGNPHTLCLVPLHTTCVGGRQVKHCVDVCSKRSTPGLQRGRCSPADVIADVQILSPERDNQQHCASAVQQPCPDMFCQLRLWQTFADQILE